MAESLTRDEVFNKLIVDPIYYEQAAVITDKLFGPANVHTNESGPGDDDGSSPKGGPGSH